MIIIMDEYTITHTMPYSGYTIAITPLPPHYMDIIEDMYPLRDYPKRMLHLISGDIVPSHYEPAAEPPDEKEDAEGYKLWHEWHDVDGHNIKMGEKRKKARVDMLYSVCVDVRDGRYKIEDEQWIIDLEAPFDDNISLEHTGRRKLLFIKTQVIRHPAEKEFITRTAMYEEVTMHGIETAVRGFWGDVGQPTFTGLRTGHGEVQS